MSEMINQDLSGVAETSLITLYIRAIESQRSDALIKDERAEELVSQMDQDALRKTTALTEDFTRLVTIVKTRDFDRFVCDFLERHPDAVVLHIGCGFDTRFERVAERNGRVEWYDMDLPEVIELRRKLIGDRGGRYHLLGCSILDDDWLQVMSAHSQHPFLFVAEGVFMYFEETQVKSLVLMLHDHFPGAELVFDAFSPFLRWSHNIKVARTRIGSPLHWALKHPQDFERWSDGIRLLDERYPFQSPERRIRHAVKLRLVPFLAKGIGVFHYQL